MINIARRRSRRRTTRRRSYTRRAYTPKRRRVYTTARRTKARRVYRRARGFGKGGILGNVIDGVLVGAVQGVIPDDAIGGFGDALVPLGVGWFRKNQTLQVIGGYQLGLKIASSMTQGGGTPGFVSQG